MNWYGAVFRKLHLDYHQPPWMTGVAARVDGVEARRQARMFREAGVEAVEVFAHDHHGFCFFPAEPPGRTHPGLAQDYTGNMVRALKVEGLRPITYLNVYTNIWLKEEHPEWVLRAPGGARTGGGWLQFEGSLMCPSSPYLEQYFVPLVRQVVRRFDIDAIWLDAGVWIADTLCECDHCRREFRRASGSELPASWPAPRVQPSDVMKWTQHGPPQLQHWGLPDVPEEDERWKAWLLWRLGQVTDYLRTVSAAVRAERSGVLLTDNSSGRFNLPLPEVQEGRFVRWLAPAELGIDFFSSDPVPWGGNHELILSREGRFLATTGVPFDFMNERFHKWGEWQLRSTTDFELEFATILANGGRCFFADQPYPDGRLEPAVYDELRRAYEFVAAREPFLRDAVLVPDVAVLAAAPSQLFGPLGTGHNAGRLEYGLVGSKWGARRTDRVDGAHMALCELGAHCLIYDERGLRAALREQSAVIVPEQTLLEDATIDALAEYVEGGGALLATGRSGWWNEAGRPRMASRLYELLGIRMAGTFPSPIHYIRLVPGALQDALEGVLPPLPVQCWGTAVRVELVDAQVMADLLGPCSALWAEGRHDEAHWQHYTTTGACPPGEDVLGPAITLRRVGRGIAAYMAVDPFAAYRHEGHRLVRLLIGGVLGTVAPAARRRIDADKPLHVELTLQRQGERQVVHLLNYFAQKRSALLAHNEEVVPVHHMTVRIRVDRPPRQVSEQPANRALTWQHQDGTVEVHVPRLDIHTMILIEF